MDPVTVDPSWIDVEFDEIEPGEDGFAGMLEESAGEQTFGQSWPDSLPLFPESEWHAQKDLQEANLGTDRPGRIYLSPYNCQSPESSCVLNAAEAQYRYLWNRIFGVKIVDLENEIFVRPYELKWSPMWMYQWIGWSRHSGSYTSDACRWMSEHGAVPESVSNHSQDPEMTKAHNRVKALCPHHYHQNTQYMGQNLHDEFKATSKYFRIRKWINISNEIQFASALLHRLPICNGRSGHSICHCDLVWDGRQWLSEYLDSYDADRGDNGRLYDTRRMWNTSGAWAAWDIYIPNNPLKPCDDDTLVIPKDEYVKLYSDLTEEEIDYWLSL